MGKNIVVCSDGTGNTAIKGRGTNVFKLFEAVDLTGHRTRPDLEPQVALYDDGVGTEQFKPLKVFAGATGFGLGRNVRQLYKELARVYDPEDRIYMFGFSRGAFTVRTLAGFMATCGLVDVRKFTTAAALEAIVERAYGVYRQCYRTALAQLFRGEPTPRESKPFREANCLPGDVPIAFMGVWDTVDAVGLPFHASDVLNAVVYRFKFPDTRLGPHVDRACQALSIDDARDAFRPVLWSEKQSERPARIEQVWFAGAHSNVGGGYPKQGMSLVALDWMMARAEAAGLRFLASDRQSYREHANPDDKLYDPRAGLGVFYRWRIRDIAALCAESGAAPKLHLTALERAAHGTEDYAPGNLPAGAAVVATTVAGEDTLLGFRVAHVQKVVRDRVDGTLLARAAIAARVGDVAYYVNLLACVLLLLAAAGWGQPEVGWGALPMLGRLLRLAVAALTSPASTAIAVARQLWLHPAPLAFPATAFLIAYLSGLTASRSMSALFSDFWHHVQPDLRHALKDARTAHRKRRAIQALEDEASAPTPPAAGPAERQRPEKGRMPES